MQRDRCGAKRRERAVSKGRRDFMGFILTLGLWMSVGVWHLQRPAAPAVAPGCAAKLENSSMEPALQKTLL